MKSRAWMLTGALILCVTLPTPAQAAGTMDKTTKYRVYQDNQVLMEFSNYKEALQYAQGYTSSHVEEIGTRKWLWNNYHRYQVYQLDYTKSEWQFDTLQDAVNEAKKWSYASIRDVQSTGWEWNNYPRYRLYQGDNTLDSWTFTTLQQAQAEAKRWGGAHIIDLSNNQWVWDNLSNQDKEALRAGEAVYKVYQGTFSADNWQFAYLEDAVNEALKWGGSSIINLQTKETVFTNSKPYKVYQNDTFLQDFTGAGRCR
ncbi:hypothetical protein [Paenibacillus hexagrammi]|uniref:Uncharacterized protein n=1 Tax=Paenibacillus hexagrammi TaxID=2908839 RepID=A0ABY3SSE7_9BACL|nr:hypothetical protein [Paenibacillus sp. YPD9-1]UJF36040.1 hypothetical protein L0M14_13760 [Paenibacillus sp. YPD9-1]